MQTYYEPIQKTETPDIIQSSHHHFSRVARKYIGLRTTDQSVISFIEARLSHNGKLHALDIGSGTGRYDIKLFECFGSNLDLICLDLNGNMLKQLSRILNHDNAKKLSIIRGSASSLPFSNNSRDVIFTFNAVHHFILRSFLLEAARILRNNGYLFIYTRLQSQNKRTIWGKYFPQFHEKEVRLYELEDFYNAAYHIPTLNIESVEYFKHQRISSLGRLLIQAKNHHYSTFSLYDEIEFNMALDVFIDKILDNFSDLDKIEHHDENAMIIINKKTV